MGRFREEAVDPELRGSPRRSALAPVPSPNHLRKVLWRGSAEPARGGREQPRRRARRAVGDSGQQPGRVGGKAARKAATRSGPPRRGCDAFEQGSARALKRQLGPVAAEERGALLEGFVLMLLRFYGEYADLYDGIRSLGTHGGTSGRGGLRDREATPVAAIEVKATRIVRPADLRGLRAIAELAGLRRRVLVFLGPRPLTTPDGIEVWPLAHFAKLLEEAAFWPSKS